MSARGRRTVGGREHVVVVDPATLEEIGTVPLMGREEVRAAIDAAHAALPAWRATPVEERAEHVRAARDYLLEHVDEISETISRETGKPRLEALVADVMIAADLMGYYASRAPEVLADRNVPIHLFKLVKQSYVRYEPIGVVSIISPYNFPLSIHTSAVTFALLAGNTVVHKPASDAVLVAAHLERAFRAAGLPEGVMNLIVASGFELGTALYEPPVRKVAFTGSTAVGLRIMQEAARHLIPVELELGGKDPMIVLEDADLDRAVPGAAWGAFSNAGQVCASVERLYLHEAIHDAFVARLKDEVERLRVGPGTEHDVDVGPLVSQEQLRTVEEQVQDAVLRGATVLVGGSRVPGLAGYFFQPTVLTGVTTEMRVAREETFGPVLPVFRFSDEEEAVRLANDSEYGLTASIWSRDRDRAERLAHRLEAGTVSINDHASTYGLPETPWHGVKMSGVGLSHSDEGLLAFAVPKHVSIDRMPLAQSPWWFPYSKGKYDAFRAGIRLVLGRRAPRQAFRIVREAVGL